MSNADLLQALGEDVCTPILAVTLVTDNLKLYFGFTKLGGSRTHPDNKIVSLEVLSGSVTPLLFPISGITKETNYGIPDIKTLLESTTATEFKAYQLQVGRSNKLKGPPFVLLPPFLTTFVLKTTNVIPLHW